MLKIIIKKIIYGYKATSESYISFLRKKGIKVGNNCFIFCPKDTSIDTLNPHLLTIGNNVKITGPATILTHDYSTCVLNNIDKRIYGKQKRTIIGNNVFLGWGCTILAGSSIGDNVIIGAGAVVSGVVENNSIYAGNPAKKIGTINEYRKRIKKNQLDDAKTIYYEYYKRNNKRPPIELFHEYFYLFSKHEDDLNETFVKKLNEENISFYNEDAEFNNYEDFCIYCERNEKND